MDGTGSECLALIWLKYCLDFAILIIHSSCCVVLIFFLEKKQHFFAKIKHREKNM